MRKFVIFLISILSVSLSAERAYLLPSRNGEFSEIIHMKSKYKLENLTLGTEFNTNKCIYQWLENTDGGGPYILTGLSDVDTFMNWFEPEAPCSILAYEVTNLNNYPGFGSDNFTMFLATLDQGINYASEFPEYHANPPPSANRGFATVVQATPATVLFADSFWTVTTDTLTTPIDNGLDVFGAGWVKPADPESTPNPYVYANGAPPYHTLMYRDRGHGKGWYSSYHCVRVRVLVNFYKNTPPEVEIEDLPDSYIQGPRTINIHTTDFFGIPLDSAGVSEVVIEYQLNDGTVNEIICNLFSGDSEDGYWRGEIPGALSGDIVTYWGIATDLQGAADTTKVYSYLIRQGGSHNFLYVDNDVHVYDPLIANYLDQMDYWDYDVYGPPDSSVLCFYANGSNDTNKTIIWRDCGCISLGEGDDYGAGIYHSDTSWIKTLLDNGGNFWLSDQDQGYGFDICPNYGVYDVPANHWIQKYIGIQGMYDDHPLILGGFYALGDSTDPIIGNLFKGIGFQNPGEVYIAPYYSLIGSWGNAYTGSFDSLQSGAIVNMSDTNGLIISYRYTGLSQNYKVYNDFWPFDYITHPDNDTIIDEVTVDKLLYDVLGWFEITAGISDRTLEPEKVIKLLQVGIVSSEAMIRFYLPEERIVSLSIYDKTGRLIRELMDGKANAGLNSIRWDGKDVYGNSVSSGIYFYQLRTGDKVLTNKFVIIK